MVLLAALLHVGLVNAVSIVGSKLASRNMLGICCSLLPVYYWVLVRDVTLGRSNNGLRAGTGIQKLNWLGPDHGDLQTVLSQLKDVFSLSLCLYFVAVECTIINMLLQQKKSKMKYSAL